jgi:hypothetical protein
MKFFYGNILKIKGGNTRKGVDKLDISRILLLLRLMEFYEFKGALNETDVHSCRHRVVYRWIVVC